MEIWAKEISTHIRFDRGVFTAGIIAGLIGGTLMAIIAMGISSANPQGPFTPFYLIGSLFRILGPAFRGTSAVGGIVGFLLHLSVSACCGGIFSLFVKRTTRSLDALFGGLVFGEILCAFMSYVVLLPYAERAISARMELAPDKWFLAHLVFGGTLCLTPTLARWIHGHTELKEESFEGEERPRANATPNVAA